MCKTINATLENRDITNIKSVMYSKTVWATLGMLVISLFGILAPNMFLPGAQETVAYWAVGGVVAMAVLIIYFRVKSTKRLVLTRHEKYGMFLFLLPSILTLMLCKTAPWMQP